ncbi:MAG: hypothetical protein ABIC82_04850 [bacterium]
MPAKNIFKKLKQKKQIELCFFVFLIILIFFLYRQNLKTFFVSDDFDWITASRNRNIFSFFITNYAGKIGGGNYCPMVNLIYFLANKIGGLDPFFYHIFSLFFHIGNAILVYIIAKHFFEKKTAIFSSLFFAVYFNHSEAVAWVSAIPHLGACFFYLLSVWLWIKYRTKKSILYIIASLISFLGALLFKEIALTFPAVLVILHTIEKERDKKNGFIPKSKNIIKNNLNFLICLLFYLLISAAYLIMRYNTTGVIWGYYGNKSFVFNLKFYIQNGVKYFISFFSTNLFRVNLKIFALNHIRLTIAIITAFLFGLGIWLKKYFKFYFLSIILFLTVSAIYLPLLMNPLNNEGERYLYLPNVLFCIFAAFLLVKLLKKYPKILLSVVVLITLYSSYILYKKNQIWNLSGQVSKKIIADFAEVVDMNKSGEKIIFLYLPDNIDGAQIFRNAIKEGISLYYPNYNLDAEVLPIYIMLQKNNWNKNLFAWKSGGENRILGKTFNQEKIITGYDRRENDNFIFELWGYDYNYSNTDTVFIKIKNNFWETTQNQKTYFLYFNKGGLQKM